jgi:hypothetical protein
LPRAPEACAEGPVVGRATTMRFELEVQIAEVAAEVRREVNFSLGGRRMKGDLSFAQLLDLLLIFARQFFVDLARRCGSGGLRPAAFDLLAMEEIVEVHVRAPAVAAAMALVCERQMTDWIALRPDDPLSRQLASFRPIRVE